MARIVTTLNEAIAAGVVQDVAALNKFGGINDVDNGPTDVWGVQGIYTGFPLGAPETVNVVSTSTNDNGTTSPQGTGAHEVLISGLKTATSTAYETETITLNGDTPVPSVSTWYRINRAIVVSAGSTGWNEGVITVSHTTTTANVFVSIPAAYGQSIVACWTVPYGCDFHLTNLRSFFSRTAGLDGSGELLLQVRKPGGAWNTKYNFWITTKTFIDTKLVLPLKFTEMTDIRMHLHTVSSINSRISCGFSGIFGTQDNIRNAIRNYGS